MVNNDFVLQELSDCLEKCRHSECLAKITQMLEATNGSIQLMDVSKCAFNADAIVNISNDKVYLRVNTQSLMDAKKVISYRDTVYERGTVCFQQGKPNDYAFELTFVHKREAENLAYFLVFVNPIYITIEDDGLYGVFDFNNFRFMRQFVDYQKVQEEVEYAEEVERFANDRENGNSDDYNENESYISNNDILSNNVDYIE